MSDHKPGWFIAGLTYAMVNGNYTFCQMLQNSVDIYCKKYSKVRNTH